MRFMLLGSCHSNNNRVELLPNAGMSAKVPNQNRKDEQKLGGRLLTQSLLEDSKLIL